MDKTKKVILELVRDHKEALRALCIILAYSIAELGIGLHNGSMLVLTQNIQNFSIAACLGTVITTSVLTTSKECNLDAAPSRENKRYPYGLQRVEILLNFVNMFLLLVANFFIFVMCLERLCVYLFSIPQEDDEEENGDTANTGTTGGLVNGQVNLGLGAKLSFLVLAFTLPIHFYLILRFDDKVTVRTEECEYEKDEKEGTSYLSLKIFANMFKNALVLLFFWYFLKSASANSAAKEGEHKDIKFTHLVDPGLAIAVSLFYCYDYFPKIKKLSKVLMQATPSCVSQKIYLALQQINRLNGVLELKDEHFWTLAPGLYVGSFTVRVRGDTDEQKIRSFAHSLFDEFMHSVCVQVEKDSWVSTSYLGNAGFFGPSSSSPPSLSSIAAASTSFPPTSFSLQAPIISSEVGEEQVLFPTKHVIDHINVAEHENTELPPPLPPPQPELQQQIKND